VNKNLGSLLKEHSMSVRFESTKKSIEKSIRCKVVVKFIAKSIKCGIKGACLAEHDEKLDLLIYTTSML